MAKQNSPETAKVDLESLKKAVRALESPKAKRGRERGALFSELYPDICEQLKADVSKTAIIKKLNDHGVSISNVIFDELLEAEAMRRGEPVPGKDAGANADNLPILESPNASQASTKEEVIT
ncbi:hypothetical protein GQ56_0119850 [Burkholderia paludis]|uniref:hypothetical protein n=1 Tax=Burkholderia paludis TaxID=1506587 RepID=UPI0005BA0A80|nr:hypothetical protein [Burkholderia paludis]KFG95535.1 hypothetical protein GQ56_0119850 [Burkholderia paludis]